MIAAKTVLCFGDSLTWGCVPLEEESGVRRFPPEIRWPGVLSTGLGTSVTVIEEGLCGRTTNIDDPTDAGLNAAKYLPTAMASHLPLDLVVLMLGTNDAKAHLHRPPIETAIGISLLVGQVRAATTVQAIGYNPPEILLIAPPALGDMRDPWLDRMFRGGREKTRQFAGLYRAAASHLQVHFLDAGTVITTDGVDGIHFSEQNNLEFGSALVGVVNSILSNR